MKLTLKRVGCISEAVIEPGEFTVFCGANNTGKTYAMYVLWSVLRGQFKVAFSFFENLAEKFQYKPITYASFDDLIPDFFEFQAETNEAAKAKLSKLFGAPHLIFSNAQLALELNQEKILEGFIAGGFILEHYQSGGEGLKATKRMGDSELEISLLGRRLPEDVRFDEFCEPLLDALFSYYSKSVFLLPAERGGLNIFQPDLDIANAQRAKLIREVKLDWWSAKDSIKNINVAQYAEPIEEYLDFLRQLPRLPKGETPLHDIATQLQQQITQVNYHVTDDGLFTAKPTGSDADLGIHLTSSTVKNFFGLWAYLETIAAPGDCLMIDEPELNLHPDNQRLIARLLARLVNRGMKVVISTHSDYIVREINNMIMLGNEFPGREDLEKTWGYDPAGSERLRVDQVAAYHFEENLVSKIEISPEYGMEVKSMDNAINRMNQSNSEIYLALQDGLHPIVMPDSLAEKSE